MRSHTKKQGALFIGLAAFGAHGGIQRFNRRIISALEQIATPAEAAMLADNPDAVRSEPSLRLPVQGFGGRRLSFLSYFFKALPRADVLLVGHINLLPFVAISKLFRPSIRTVLFAHGVEIWGDSTFRAPRWWEPWVTRNLVDQVAVVSRFSRDRMAAAFRLEQAKFSIFPNAVDLVNPAVLRTSSNTVLCVSRLGSGEREKHVDKLVFAFLEVLELIPDARLQIVGDGPLKGELESLSVSLGISDHIELLGSVDDQRLADAYAKAAVFALPSSKEGFGIVYLEAWLRGLPVIGSVHGAAAEVIKHGVDGFVVEPTDISALAKAVIDLLKSPTLSLEMAAAGRQKVVDYYSSTIFTSNLRSLIVDQ